MQVWREHAGEEAEQLPGSAALKPPWRAASPASPAGWSTEKPPPPSSPPPYTWPETVTVVRQLVPGQSSAGPHTSVHTSDITALMFLAWMSSAPGTNRLWPFIFSKSSLYLTCREDHMSVSSPSPELRPHDDAGLSLFFPPNIHLLLLIIINCIM